MTKNSYDRFFVSNLNFSTENVKIIKNSRFIFKISQIPGYFCTNCRIPGFSRFPGKMATLFYVVIFCTCC